MDISNRSLALLLVFCIVVSLGVTFINLNRISEMKNIMPATGHAAATGNMSLTIQTNASCNVDTNVSFGTGRPTLNYTLSTNQSNALYGFACDGATYASGCYGIVINNTGNVVLNISMNSSVNGTGLLGAPQNENDFTWRSTNKLELASCTTPQNFSWLNVNTTQATNTTNVCTYLNDSSANNIVVIEFNVTIIPTIDPGIKSATMNIGCSQ